MSGLVPHATGAPSRSQLHAPSPPDGPARPHKRRRRPPRPGIHLNIIPLVDVTFLLMIFFVIAGTFERFEGALSARMLPTGPGAGVPLPFTPVVLRLRAAGAGPDDYLVSMEGSGKSTSSFPELASMLRAVRENPGFSEETPVVIFSDPTVRWDHVVNAWNSAVRAGYRNVAFGSN